jgi:uncharacterized protein YaaR (DUF327 family)
LGTSVTMPASQLQRRRTSFDFLSRNRRYEVIKELDEKLEYLSGGDKKALLEQYLTSKQGRYLCENLQNKKKEKQLDKLMSNISKQCKSTRSADVRTMLISLVSGTNERLTIFFFFKILIYTC